MSAALKRMKSVVETKIPMISSCSVKNSPILQIMRFVKSSTRITTMRLMIIRNSSFNLFMYLINTQKFDLQRARILQVDDNRSKLRMNPFKKSLPHQPRNQSNSPLKEVFSPKKEMFRSLYGQSFGGDQFKGQVDRGNLLSTLGMSNWRGKHKSQSKK